MVKKENKTKKNPKASNDAPKNASRTGKREPQTLVLLDAHAILHRAYHALPDFTSPTGAPTGALYGVVAMLLKIIEELKPDYVVACFDLPKPTYRHEVYKEYKSGRKKTDDSLVEQITRSRDIFAAFGIPIYEHEGFEADDMLGTIAEQTKENKNLSVIIASGDMDTLQLVEKKRVQVYTLRKGIKDTVMYDEKAVKERFLFGPTLVPDYKGLRGDPSDNIPGIQGIGEKSATELVRRFGGVDDIYKKLKKNEEQFLEAGIKPRIVNLLKEGEEEAQFSKMLAVIRRDAPITFSLPEKNWQEALELEEVLDLFATLGFRTLATRVQELFGEVEEEEVEEVSDVELCEATIALWLVHSDTTNPTYDDVVAYGRAQGANTFAESKDLILKTLKEQNLEHIYTDIELPLMEVLDAMHTEGIRLDTDYLKTLSQKLHKELAAIETKIYKLAGAEFNIKSPKQLGEVLYDTLELKPKNQKKTAGGQRSTKESELEKLRDEHEIIPLILRFRELQKLLSTYIDNLPDMVAKDGRLHSTFLQAGTTTGRMSSKNPNIQNIPVRTEEGRAIRGGFVAEEGFELVAIDYSQIELRIAAILSEDEKMLTIFREGEDVHQGVASRVFGVAPDEVTADMRRRAKVINFGILYGMGVNALRSNLGDETTRAEAQEFLNAYFNTFTRLAEYLEETKEHARQHGYTETMYGRRRYFPGMTSSAPFIRAQAERMAINAPVQGTAADVTRIAMVNVYVHLKEKKHLKDVRMLLQVHDELIFEIKEELVATVTPDIVAVMEGVLSERERHGVPLKVDVKVGKSWDGMESFDATK
ncbi:MAG: DNA polymerase [Candidatus Pacebacteria bacterium]|nr:DNA polymerase [Candidatus Paceibacterota bacterium]